MKATHSQQTPSGGSDQILVRVLPCDGCGYPFDRELLGKYGCPNCEGEITENATKQNLQENSPLQDKGLLSVIFANEAKIKQNPI